MMTPEQFTSTYKSNLESFFALSNKAFEGFEKLVDLNLNVAKATQAELAEKLKELFALREAQEFAQFGISLAQPTAEKALAYTRHVSEIAKSTQAEFVRFAESQLAEGNRKLVTLIDSAAKNAPTGSESAFAMMKSALAAANSALDSAKKAGQQFVDVTEANFAAATNATVKAANQAASVSKLGKKAA
ncbi:MAG TPA: TIGR01841 family phasin [Burkholderiaceae bacterium]|nr:TIGR01841 family phasin [Burkholderiaceae bacterium]